MIYTDLWYWGLEQFKSFLLVWMRIGGLFVMMPFFGSDAIPERYRAMLSLALAAVIFPTLRSFPAPVWDNLGFFLYAALTELAIGIVMGLVVLILFGGLHFAGEQVGIHMGLSMANILDPMTEEQVSVIGQLLFFVAFMAFLAMNGHHEVLRIMRWSFDHIPPAALVYREEAVKMVSGWPDGIGPDAPGVTGFLPRMFIHGIILSAPPMLAILFVTVAMGFMARAAPEMNVFILGFAVRILIGFWILWISMDAMAAVFSDYLQRMLEDLRTLVTFFMPDV
ncbi:MAG: flagellar biosynthetic protein FliR [Planctomycetes bacterium]|nr:flagellar biosynthetic protein FliR [Planctomycetota bacterium]